MDIVTIRMMRVRPDRDADIELPQYMTSDASGMDIRAAVESDCCINPGDIAIIPTGIAAAIPEGFEAQIRPRSGLAAKHGIGIVNSPGTIDSDYRGEIMVPLINFGKQPFTVKRGDRIAQMVIQKVYKASVLIADSLEKTDRNTGGFGHTGI